MDESFGRTFRGEVLRYPNLPEKEVPREGDMVTPKVNYTYLEYEIPMFNNIVYHANTATDGVYLSLSFMEVVENFVLEENIVGVTSDGGGNLWFCKEALESKYTNESNFFHYPSPYSPWSVLHIYFQGMERRE